MADPFEKASDVSSPSKATRFKEVKEVVTEAVRVTEEEEDASGVLSINDRVSDSNVMSDPESNGVAVNNPPEE